MKNLFTKSNYVFKSFISILFCSYSLERQSNQNCSLYLRNKSRALVVAGAGRGRVGDIWTNVPVLELVVSPQLSRRAHSHSPLHCNIQHNAEHILQKLSKIFKRYSLLTAGKS